MERSMRRTRVVPIVVAIAALIIIYIEIIRPRTMRWGATDEEVARVLPGDGLVRGRCYSATRAITIGAPARFVWPWLVQMGSGRAGWYAIDQLDNAGVPSAESVLPWFQNLRVGDLVPMAVDEEVGPRVKEIEPERRLLLWNEEDGFTWEWVLDPIDERATRLISRIREAYPPLLSKRMPYAIVASAGDIVMIHRQLKGIKARAERLFASTAGSEVAV